MPVHDWTRVDAGIFHAFTFGWVAELSRRLNEALDSRTHYALIAPAFFSPSDPDYLNPGPDADLAYTRRQKRITIHAIPGDRVVAIVEIVGPTLKRCPGRFRRFVLRCREAIRNGIGLCVFDLIPPIPAAANGVHRLIWSPFGGPRFPLPADKPLTLAAYAGGPVKRAYVEPVAVGDSLPDMPLFLTPETYVPVLLDATYREAWAKMPHPWRDVLEPPPASA